MSSSAATRLPSDSAHDHRRVRALVSWLEGQSLLIMALAVVAVVSLVQLPQHITQDTWLALAGGRYVAAHGIPQHDTLFVITHGARWVDQQWLAQLALYGLNAAGGLALYGLVYVALTFAGFTIALAAGRKLGGSERHALWVLPIAGFLFFAGSSNVRTQGFAYPLFSATLWLLAREVRGSRDRRVYLVFPLLILWANLHGSVTLGVGLAMICGAVLLIGDLRGDGSPMPLRRIRARSVLLIVASPICLLITPYGLATTAYYRETILNPGFSKVISEWQPVTSSMALAIPVFALAFASVWLMGRSGRRMPTFDQLALVMLAAAAIFAVRNVAWYGLGAMVLLPRTLTALLPEKQAAARRAGINLSLLGVSLAVLLIAIVTVATRPATWFQRSFDPRALAAVSQIAQREPGVRIYADNRFADWLLWSDPRLAGRMAYDIRFELLTSKQLQNLVDSTQIPTPHEHSILNGYRLLVLDRTSAATPRLLARSGTRVVLRGHGVVVATWRPQS